MTLKSATKIAVVKLIQFVFKARHASQEIGRDRRGSQVGLSMKCGKSAFSELDFFKLGMLKDAYNNIAIGRTSEAITPF